MEARILAEEERREALRAEMELPGNASDAPKLLALLGGVNSCQAEIDRLYARWAVLEALAAPDRGKG